MCTPGPSLIEVIQPSRCQTRGVLSLSLSSGCDSGSALIPLPSIPSSVSQPDRGFTGIPLQNHRRALRFMNQWNMLQTLHPATPFPGSTLAFAHNSLLSSYKTQKRRGLRRSWECTDWWENLWEECYYHCAMKYINRPACIVPHDLEALMQKEERMSGCLLVSSCWQVICEISLCASWQVKMYCITSSQSGIKKQFSVNLGREAKWTTSSIKGQISFSSSDSKVFPLRVDQSFTTSGRRNSSHYLPSLLQPFGRLTDRDVEDPQLLCQTSTVLKKDILVLVLTDLFQGFRYI